MKYNFKEKIKPLLKKADLSLGELADKLGVSRQHLDDLLKGENNLTLDWIHRISKALNCDPSFFTSTSPGNVIPIEKPSARQAQMIDHVRLNLVREAVEKTIKEKSLKLSKKALTKFLSDVYNETTKYELQGEPSSPKIIASFLADKIAWVPAHMPSSCYRYY